MRGHMSDVIEQGIPAAEQSVTFESSLEHQRGEKPLSPEGQFIWMTLVYGTHQGHEGDYMYEPDLAVLAVETMLAECGIEYPYPVPEVVTQPAAERLS
jgi:hypothetical protein